MDSEINEVEQRLLDNGYEDAIYLTNYDYSTALIGMSNDGRCIYDYDLMVEYLVNKEGWTEEESMEWIDYNTIRALPYMGPESPIIMHKLME